METADPASDVLRRENEDLRDQLAKLKADKEFVWALWKKLQVATPDVSQAVSLVAQRERERSEAKDQKVLQILQAKDARLEELESQNVRLSSEMSGLMKQKADLLERVERLDAEIVNLHDKNRHLQGQLKSVERGAQSHDSATRDSLARSEAEASRLRAQVGALQAEAAELRDQAASARLTARQALDEARAARAAAAVDKERRDQLEGQAALLQQVQSLQEGTQAMLETQSDELACLRAEVQRWRDRCAELEARLDTKSDAKSAAAPVPDYPYKVAQLEAQISSLKSRLRGINSTPVPQAMVELQSRVNASTKRAAAAEAELRLRDAETARLSAELRKKTARVKALKVTLQQARADGEQRLEAEQLLGENARLQNELALAQVQLVEHTATSQQLRKSLEFERRACAELREAVESAAASATARPEELRILNEELESARRKVLQLRDLIGRQTRELEAHSRARREADDRADAARAELARKNQVLIEMKRYLRHLGRRVSGLRTMSSLGGGSARVARPNFRSRAQPHDSNGDDDFGWEDLPTDDDFVGVAFDHDPDAGSGLDDATADLERRQPDSGCSLGRAIAAKASAADEPSRPMSMARLQARAGALQQQLLQCRRSRQKTVAERDRLSAELNRQRSELAQCQARCRRLKEACDKAQQQLQQTQSTKDPGYHSEGPTADDNYLGGEENRAGLSLSSSAAAAAAEAAASLASCRQAKARIERELRSARDTIEELRRRVRSAEESAAADRTAAERAKSKVNALKENVRRSQSQLEASRTAATSAGEQRRRFEQLWQEARAELDQARARARSLAADSERRRRLADEASARSTAAEAAARDELSACQAKLGVADRLLGQIARLAESKADTARLLLGAYCDRLQAAPPILPSVSTQSTTTEHQMRARQRAAGILHLTDCELDSLLNANQATAEPASSACRIGQLRLAMGSRETDKQWANQCLRLAQAIRNCSLSGSCSNSEADQLLDKFSEKFDEFVNAVRLLAV